MKRSGLVLIMLLSFMSCNDNDNAPSKSTLDARAEVSSASDIRIDDGSLEDLNCSFAARCMAFDSGLASCYSEKNPNPCCPGPIHFVITPLFDEAAGVCRAFTNDCLPKGEGWSDCAPDLGAQ